MNYFYCWKCQGRFEKGHSHAPAIPSEFRKMVEERGSCGCSWHLLKSECRECKKLMCGKNGPHCIRLTKNNIEAANGIKKLCIDCGNKIRIGAI